MSGKQGEKGDRPQINVATGVEKMTIKQKEILLISIVVIQTCYILNSMLFPNTTTKECLIKQLSEKGCVKLEPTSLDLIAMFVYQRYDSLSSLVKYMREHFSDSPGLLEYLEWLEGNLEKGERESQNQLSVLNSFLDQGGNLYEYSSDNGVIAEHGLIVLHGFREKYRIPFFKTQGGGELRGELRGQAP